MNNGYLIINGQTIIGNRQSARGCAPDTCPPPTPGHLVDAEVAGPDIKIPGRNDPCYCGSGKKFKKCCGF